MQCLILKTSRCPPIFCSRLRVFCCFLCKGIYHYLHFKSYLWKSLNSDCTCFHLCTLPHLEKFQICLYCSHPPFWLFGLSSPGRKDAPGFQILKLLLFSLVSFLLVPSFTLWLQVPPLWKQPWICMLNLSLLVDCQVSSVSPSFISDAYLALPKNSIPKFSPPSLYHLPASCCSRHLSASNPPNVNFKSWIFFKTFLSCPSPDKS